jgi:hypothetical protein
MDIQIKQVYRVQFNCKSLEENKKTNKTIDKLINAGYECDLLHSRSRSNLSGGINVTKVYLISGDITGVEELSRLLKKNL